MNTQTKRKDGETALAKTTVYELSLNRTGSVSYPIGENVIHSQKATDIAKAMIGHKDCEHFIVIMLNPRGKVVSSHLVAIGGMMGVTVKGRDVFKAALVANAASIVIAHNHPSGDPTPSRDDIVFTNRIVTLGLALDCPIVDHIIVAGSESMSFADSGILPKGDTL